MKKFFATVGFFFLVVCANAQIKSATLQASGLTCSMCSKAVLNALQKLPFVSAVNVDLQKQEYELSFKPEKEFEFDDLSKAVEDAGFSVAQLQVMTEIASTPIGKDQHINIGGYTFHFLNSEGKELNGPVNLTLIDKNFTSAKTHKKYASKSKMSCVATGKMEKCCSNNEVRPERIYHVII